MYDIDTIQKFEKIRKLYKLHTKKLREKLAKKYNLRESDINHIIKGRVPPDPRGIHPSGILRRRYGRLVARSMLPPLITVHGSRRMVECVCDCGTVCKVQLDRLRSGQTKSCGCLKRKRTVIVPPPPKAAQPKIEDMLKPKVVEAVDPFTDPDDGLGEEAPKPKYTPIEQPTFYLHATYEEVEATLGWHGEAHMAIEVAKIHNHDPEEVYVCLFPILEGDPSPPPPWPIAYARYRDSQNLPS